MDSTGRGDANDLESAQNTFDDGCNDGGHPMPPPGRLLDRGAPRLTVGRASGKFTAGHIRQVIPRARAQSLRRSSSTCGTS